MQNEILNKTEAKIFNDKLNEMRDHLKNDRWKEFFNSLNFLEKEVKLHYKKKELKK